MSVNDCRIEQLERYQVLMRAELAHARQKNERLISVLAGIHGLLYPPKVVMRDGRLMEFRPLSLDPHKAMQMLSDRIREIPDKIEEVDCLQPSDLTDLPFGGAK